MRIITDDGKEFTSMESYKKYEASLKDSEREKLLDSIANLHEKIKDWMDKESDLLAQYSTKYPNHMEDVLDVLDIFDEDDEDDDEDEDCNKCADCEDYDECVTQAAINFIDSFETLQDLIHRLD